MHIGALAWLTVLASMEGEKPEANMTFIALQVQIGAVVVVYSLMAVWGKKGALCVEMRFYADIS